MKNMFLALSHQSLQWFLCFSGFLDLFGVSMIFPLLVQRAHALGATPSQVGLFGSLYGTLQFFASPAMGQISDYVGRKNVAVVAMLGTAVSYFLLGQATTMLYLCLARIPSGIFKFSQSMSRTLLADISLKTECAAVFGTFNSMSSLGFIVGPAIGGILASQDNGFLKAATLSSGIFLFNAVLVYCLVPSTPLHKMEWEDKKEKKQFSLAVCSPFSMLRDLSLIPWRNIWQRFAILFLFALGIKIFRSNFTSILMHRFDVDTRTNGFIMSFNGIVSAFGSAMVCQISPFFSNNNALHNTFAAVFVLALLLICLAPTLTIVIFALVPLSFSNSVLRVTNSVATYEKGGTEVRGLLVGVSDTITALSRALAPAIGGFALELTLFGPGLCGTFFAFLATCVGFLDDGNRIKC